jgi:uncharacterized protein (TIGR02646 family)
MAAPGGKPSAMIPVTPQPEPPEFDQKVRQRGQKWLHKKLSHTHPATASAIELKPYWQACLDELHQGYQGICAYLCIYVDRAQGSATVDHFQPKSQRPDLAYEWSNYRLACQRMNNSKRDFTDVLDPFTVQSAWFRLDFADGRIYAAPDLQPLIQTQVNATITRLRLNAIDLCKLRIAHWNDYIRHSHDPREGVSASYLREKSPFVWSEAKRQELL